MRSKDTRMYGQYIIKAFEINEKDSIELFIYKDVMSWISVGTYNAGSESYPWFIIENDSLSGGNYGGIWEWRDNRNTIRIDLHGYPKDFLLMNRLLFYESSFWDIKKLTNKEFFLETENNNLKYRLELQKKY
ncbi:MAG: hypothetical protein Kow0068_01570 [Marinilabiliales bacterium]